MKKNTKLNAETVRRQWEIESSLPVESATVLNAVYAFLGRFVAYPSEHAQIAHVLWIAHTHLMDAWESTPRLAFLSPEPASGKTRALEISELLVPNAVEAINVTPAYLFRKVGDEERGPPTILYDEIDTVFGPKAKENEEIRGLLNAGHRRGAVAGRCLVRGRTVETEEISAYCAVALAGLGWLPDTILTRSVIIRMRRRAPSEMVTPFRRRVHTPDGHELRDQLTIWAAQVADTDGRRAPGDANRHRGPRRRYVGAAVGYRRCGGRRLAERSSCRRVHGAISRASQSMIGCLPSGFGNTALSRGRFVSGIGRSRDTTALIFTMSGSGISHLSWWQKRNKRNKRNKPRKITV